MKWSTHKRIVYEICNQFVESKYARVATKHSIDPDKYFQDYNAHHFNNKGLQNIKHYITKSRKCLLHNGNLSEAMKNFGIASHYIADGVLLPHLIPKAYDREQHARYEHLIDVIDKEDGWKIFQNVMDDDAAFDINNIGDVDDVIDYMSNIYTNKNNLQTKLGINNTSHDMNDDVYLAYFLLYNFALNLTKPVSLTEKHNNKANEILEKKYSKNKVKLYGIFTTIGYMVSIGLLFVTNPIIAGMVSLLITLAVYSYFDMFFEYRKSTPSIFVNVMADNIYKFTKNPSDAWYKLKISK
jgi:hypothetical protein